MLQQDVVVSKNDKKLVSYGLKEKNFKDVDIHSIPDDHLAKVSFAKSPVSPCGSNPNKRD